MKKTYLSIACSLFIMANAQNNYNLEKHLDKNTTQELLDLNSKFKRNTTSVPLKFDISDFKLAETNNTIKSYFNFSNYYQANQSRLFTPSITFTNTIILKKDSVKNFQEKHYVEIIPLSLEECEYRSLNLFLEKVYLLKLKEVQTFYYLDEQKYTKTIIHHFWFNERYSNYLTKYTQVVTHTPYDVPLNYEENLSENSVDLLEKEFLNETFETAIIYPNPITVNEPINIKITTSEEKDIAFDFYQMDGKATKVITHTKKGNNVYLLDIGKVARGMYILKGVLNNKNFTNKIIVE